MASRRNPVIEPPDGLRITKLRFDEPAGMWRANVSLGNGSVPVQSAPHWSIEHAKGGPFQSVKQEIAAALQGAVATHTRSAKRATNEEG